MEAAVEDVRILPGALFTHRKGFHGGHWTIIRQITYDGKPGPAIGAVRKRVVDPVRLGLHIVQAVLADSNIRTHIGNFI